MVFSRSSGSTSCIPAKPPITLYCLSNLMKLVFIVTSHQRGKCVHRIINRNAFCCAISLSIEAYTVDSWHCRNWTRKKAPVACLIRKWNHCSLFPWVCNCHFYFIQQAQFKTTGRTITGHSWRRKEFDGSAFYIFAFFFQFGNDLFLPNVFCPSSL